MAKQPVERTRPPYFPDNLPWPPPVRDYPPDHPACRRERSTVAFNRDWAIADFGSEYIERLESWHRLAKREFTGDWWEYVFLLMCADLEIDGTHEIENAVKLDCYHSVRRRGVGGFARHLEGMLFDDEDLSWLSLVNTRLDGSRFSGCILRSVYMPECYLNDVYISHCDMSEIDLSWSELNGARITECDLSGANLADTLMNGTSISHVDMTGADLRRSEGGRCDEWLVRDLRIEADAPDPWSVLRRTYTGPWFFIHAAFLAVFAAPYVIRACTLTMVADTWQAVEDLTGSTLSSVATVPAWHVLIGLDQGWPTVAIGCVLVAYNILRGYLTLRVGMLRDAEERSGVSPALSDYMGARIVLDKNMFDAGAEFGRRIWPRIKFRILPKKPDLSPLDWPDPAEFAAFGYWRLHRISRWLMWISFASMGFHVVRWVLTAEVPLVTLTSP